MRKLIFLIGQRERSGTNYVGSALFQHPQVCSLPLNTSFGELNLFIDDAIEKKIFNKIIGVSFGVKKPFYENKHRFYELYGQLWTQLIEDVFKAPKDKVIFIKSPVIYNIDLWQRTFPESKIAVILRDGRDNVVSCVKTSYDFRKSHSIFKKFKIWINYISGRSFLNNVKKWNETGQLILKLVENEKLSIFRYEELLKSRNEMKKLLDFYGLESNEDVVESCVKAPVVGSSTVRGRDESNWEPDYDKSKYSFTKKWSGWGIVKKAVFKTIAGQTLVDLGYEKNSHW